MNTTHSILIIAVIALVTMALRFLPFLIFSGNRQTPPLISYLGRVLPYAIIGMLVVYCFKNVSFVSRPFGLPEILAGGLVVVLHAWKSNTLLSILTGTAAYMVLIQLIH